LATLNVNVPRFYCFLRKEFLYDGEAHHGELIHVCVFGAASIRGRALGFPTANVSVPENICLPADGVYAGTFAAADGISRLAAISVGRRPTFYAEAGMCLCEAFVLDFDGDLYGQPSRVAFTHRLRGQERFDQVDDLVAQMHRDVARVRELSRSEQ